MKVAVIYYSFEGNTKSVAIQISEKFNADLYEIKEVKETVPKKGFFKYLWGGKQVITKKTPEIEELNIDVDSYDIIFIGTPVWAFTYAPAIRTFFSKYKITCKKIGLFCSHEGGMKNTMKDMQKCLANNEFIQDFNIISPLKNESSSRVAIDNWLSKIKLD